TDDQKQVRAVFTNPAGSVISQAAVLTVRVPAISLSNLSATSIAARSVTLRATSTGSAATITRQGFEYVAGIYTDAQFNQTVQPVGTQAQQNTFGPPAVVPGDYSISIGALSPGTTYTYLAFVVDDFVQ